MRDPTGTVEGDPQVPGDEHVVAVATPADFAATLG
jgi:hypothetical protein